jgi:hypothetical protein
MIVGARVRVLSAGRTLTGTEDKECIVSRSALTPLEILQRMEVPGYRGVFTLGNFARQVTFASQQTRAFNLIWALFQERRLIPGSRVAVVGAGLAGLTAAVAALSKRCRIDMYEQASQPFPLQRGNDIRFIHPNILRWPEPGSESAHTDFPLLNWTAANVRSVIRQIDIQWRRHSRSDQLCQLFNYKVTRLHAGKTDLDDVRPWLVANRVIDGGAPGEEGSSMYGTNPPIGGGTGLGFVERAYDAVILAVGFGEERAVDGVPFLSYWENDSLHQEVGTRGRRSILVSGCGDGGLIDALRLRLRNFDHAEFVRRFQSAAGSEQMKKRLTEIERELRPHARAADISIRFQTAYDDVPVPEEVRHYFRSERRADTTVTLNSPDAGPLSYKSSLLNRYATYLALRHADLRYLSGHIVTESASPGRFDVVIEQSISKIRESRAFDLVVVRHGPRSVLDPLVSSTALSELRTAWSDAEDLSTQPCWHDEDQAKPHQFFVEVRIEEPTIAEEEVGLARVAFDSAFDSYSRDPLVQSVAVATQGERVGYIVTLRHDAPGRPTERFAGVTVYFVNAPADSRASKPSPRPRTSVKPVRRKLPVGIGIYNYDQRWRVIAAAAKAAHAPQQVDPAVIASPIQRPSDSIAGTLGCFAKDEIGARYLISTSHIFGPLNDAQVGDRIFLESESPDDGDRPIARLHRFSEFHDGDGGVSLDVASAKLEAGVDADYGPLINAKINLVGVGDASLGQRVRKFSRRGGITKGIVRSVDASVKVMKTDSATSLFTGCVDIRSTNDDPFMVPGDSGSIVVGDDGVAIGLLFAGSTQPKGRASQYLACSLKKALEELRLMLLPARETRGHTGSQPRSSSNVRATARTQKRT